jgi:ribonucleases P/MRP protein subunit RPP40
VLARTHSIHVLTATAIELDLHAPSMLHGKKLFQRLFHAFETVLNKSFAWVFIDLKNPKDLLAGPISKHAPILRQVKPTVTRLPGMRTPVIEPAMELSDPYHAEEVFEWLGLISLESPRVSVADSMDPFLSRYEVPSLATAEEIDSPIRTTNLVKLEWKGLASADFITHLYVAARRQTLKSWCALSASTFDERHYTVLSMGPQDVLCWETWD